MARSGVGVNLDDDYVMPPLSITKQGESLELSSRQGKDHQDKNDGGCRPPPNTRMHPRNVGHASGARKGRLATFRR
jgi:hypothetical protein